MSQSISWDEFLYDVYSLVNKIKNYSPQVIVPVISGGLIPGAIIAELLDIKDVRPIGIERAGEDRKIYYPLYGDINNLDLMIVEDTLKTGIGPCMVKSKYDNMGARVRISAIYITPQCQSLVDYYARIYDPLPNLPWKSNNGGNRVVHI
jgi:hypoxanthine phosphoribosyltransferase